MPPPPRSGWSASGSLGARSARPAVRAALGRLTVAASGGPEELRAALARACGDPTLTIVVPHPESGDPLTLDGHPAPPERARTAVERQGRLVAWLDHDPGVPVIPEIARPAALTLEREALLASQRLQEEEVRASTARLVEAGDAERRRLERDLHDGAQQRLLALGIAVERAPTGAAARTRLRAMREDLRRIAHGIHSVPLAESGLAEAVLALVDAAGASVTVEVLPDRRASAAAEAALYRYVADGVAAGARYPAGDRGDGRRADRHPPGGRQRTSPRPSPTPAPASPPWAASSPSKATPRAVAYRSRGKALRSSVHAPMPRGPRSATVLAPTTKEEP